ncbi:MAG TPA: sulfotransferase, partial [Acidimicrobiia bacterium]|nr:sulfotransferase [Acidimicrobiia bacterium]
MGRFFLVGCPRSGTTLLQSMVAQHPRVFTIPETHYFHKIRGRLASRSVGPLVSPRAAARALDSLVEAVDSGLPRPQVPRWWLSRGRYCRAFFGVLDRAAAARGAEVWLEKSPIHLHYLEEIMRFAPVARFVHLLRDGRDVVASLVDLCERDGERWIPQLLPLYQGVPDRSTLIRAAADRWNSDIGLSLRHLGDPGHVIVSYEALIDNPPAVLGDLCSFMSLDYHEAMLRPWEAANEVVGWRRGMAHMERTFHPLQDRRGQRYLTQFSQAEQEAV